MSDITIGLIGAFGGLIAGLIGAYVTMKTLKPNIQVLKSEEQRNIADAMKSAVDTLTDSLAITDRLQERVTELETGREERTKEIQTLKQQIESLNREYTREITLLRDKYNTLKTEYVNVLNVLKENRIEYQPKQELLDTGEKFNRPRGEK